MYLKGIPVVYSDWLATDNFTGFSHCHRANQVGSSDVLYGRVMSTGRQESIMEKKSDQAFAAADKAFAGEDAR